ncbi:hypothetical protein [Jeotgalicoccus sp. WY2]|uniref:hypothetical protein n=1 Tax=Jeotgalicoccus sp. WY2 TaxID=2708346 RepID=UPI001BD36327|nr:hypothetical protein [Jeotgalicoccus sp. WY2]
MQYTVKELLTLEELQDAEYIGTKQSLSKNIKGITVIDSPDISLWLKRRDDTHKFLPGKRSKRRRDEGLDAQAC